MNRVFTGWERTFKLEHWFCQGDSGVHEFYETVIAAKGVLLGILCLYQFYHQSLKIYGVQNQTLEIVKQLQEVAPHLPMNAWLMRIVEKGIVKSTVPKDNRNRLNVTHPILEAYFHAHVFLEMAVKYGNVLKSPPRSRPSGWAALLYLFNLR